MQRFVRLRSAWAISLLLTALNVGVLRADEVIDRVLGVVAGNLIMQSDVRAAREFGLVSLGNADDVDRAVLSQLIDRALILNEVERYAPPEPTVDAIDQALSTIRGGFPTDESFATAL